MPTTPVTSTSFPVSLLLMVPVGAGGIAMAATANAVIQLAVPDGLRGRVMSVYTTVFSASVPIGGLAMGVLASAVGIPMTIAIGGLLSLATGVAALVWWRRISSRAVTARAAQPSATKEGEPWESTAGGPETGGPMAVEAAAESAVGEAAMAARAARRH